MKSWNFVFCLLHITMKLYVNIFQNATLTKAVGVKNFEAISIKPKA